MDYLQHGGDRLLPLFHLGRDRLRAHFDPERFARRPADPQAAPGFEARIEEIWNKRKEENSRIYNASKFRWFHDLEQKKCLAVQPHMCIIVQWGEGSWGDTVRLTFSLVSPPP